MLRARDLAIGHRTAIGRDIALEVAPGRILCLLGPNGCGKTTLFRTLLGLIPAHGGAITLDGRPMARLSRPEIARALAYVPQTHAPPFPYRAEEIVLMGRTARLPPFAAPAARDRAAAHAALARLRIAELGAKDYSRLSGGQRQLVLIARALAQESPLLVLDEPTASLDFGNQARVLTEIAHLSREGRHGAILSTHDPDQAFALDAEVVLMHDGRIVAQGAPETVLTPERLTEVYGVPVAVERTETGRLVCAPSLARAA